MSNPALVEALKRKFGKVRGTEWLRFACPTCAPHNRKKMKRTIHCNGYTSNCFICGIRLNVTELLDEYIPNLSFTTHEVEEEKAVDPRALVLPYNQAIPVNQLPEDHPAVQFLYKDELRDLDTYANVHKIVYVPYEGGTTFHNGKSFITSAERIVFPVYFEHKLVGWQMRSLPGTFYGDMDEDIRYYHLFNKGSYLYNYDQAKQHDRVIVVEGVKKALKFPNGVATWGAGISRRQLKLIQTWKEIVMLLDSDEKTPTQERARGFVENINAAAGKVKAINVNLADWDPKFRSPDDLPANVLQLMIDEQWNEQIHH